jgi:hypothetical protein
MTDSDVSMPGEREDLLPPPSLDSESASFAGQLQVRKLVATQVIIWLALTVLMIAIGLALPVVQAASFAACLVASGALIRSQCFRMLGRLQPGHWIVLIWTTAKILECLTRPFGFLTIACVSGSACVRLDFNATPWFGNVLSVFGIVSVVAMFVFAAIRLHDAKGWKVLLLLSSASAGTFFLQMSAPLGALGSGVQSSAEPVLKLCPACVSAILVVIAVLAIVNDWPRRASRDWVHWLGVSFWTLANAAAVPFGLMIASQWTRH